MLTTGDPIKPAGLAFGRAPMLIDGAWVGSSDGRWSPVETPAKRGSVIAEVPRGTEADVDRAVRAADRAFASWRLTSAAERARLLSRIADDIEADAEEIARTTATETGNALRTQARPEARLAVAIFRYFAGVTSELKGETIPLGEDVLSYTRREPLGVVGGIIPWNAPIQLGTVKVAMALAAGNTLVLKPSTDAPLGTLRVARICAEHLPPGVLNVVTGSGSEAGAPLASHPLVRKLSFTGSTEVGKRVMAAAADRIVPISLELGGKSPCVVFRDVGGDDRVVDGVIAAMRFTRQGQSCTAGSRLFLHADVYDGFLERLSTRLEALVVGDPLDETTDVGAVINRTQFDKIHSYVEEGCRQQGARLVTGGLPPQDGPLAQGYFHRPTVFADVRNEWRIAREEIFGPVLVAIRWTAEDEMLRMANDTHYGLGAYVWSREIGAALRTAHAVEAGWVQVNQGLGQVPGQSYGGYKQSGLGREFSLEGMLESFTQRKNVTVSVRF